MDDVDAFQLNINGVSDLIQSGTNKSSGNPGGVEGIQGETLDEYDLGMSDEELLDLRDEWEGKNTQYDAKIRPRQQVNKEYYLGVQKQSKNQKYRVVPSNLIFEAEETFIPQALSQNPEPVVWSDNTMEGKDASSQIKTMLQYHADVLSVRRKLAMMVRHWSIYFIGVIKYGWDSKVGDISAEVRKPQNFVLDPDGFIDEYGNFDGEYVGERIESTAGKLIKMFPKYKEYITSDVGGKLGTKVVRTEWWKDEYCFTTYKTKVLEKHRNEFFNYDLGDSDSATPGLNHFARPKMPYTFLSVFSLQEQPHDITNLIEQNIANQDRINDRDMQIDKNLRNGNNSLVVSGKSFDVETAGQAAQAMEQGDPVLVPDGNVDSGIKRMPANDIPSSVFTAQANDKETLRSVFGTNGLTPQASDADQTARGMILDQTHDSSRIGGGVGDAIEQVADTMFNWFLQLYYVFYDEAHYAAVMGTGQAIEYTMLINTNMNRKFVVSVSPNSMSPKDEVSEMNNAINLWNAHALDPINLFKKLNYPDPVETARMVTLWTLSPQVYFQTYFPEQTMPMGQGAPQEGQIPPQQEGQTGAPLSAPPASAALSQVPISTQALPQ